jgi:predicted Zn-dependent protease
LGELAFKQMSPSLKLLARGEVLNTVQFVGVRVSTGSRLRYQFHVAESPEMDAMALPGGHIVVFTGLLRGLNNADELAAVLAQEASHIEKRHVLSHVIHALGWRATFGALTNDFSGSVWNGMVDQLRTKNYSDEWEREADSEALVMLKRAGVSAEGLLSFLGRKAENERVESRRAAIHQRIADLRAQMAAQSAYSSQPLPVDWQQFQQALSALPTR